MNLYTNRLSVGQIITLVGSKLLDDIKAVVPFIDTAVLPRDIESAAYLKEIFPSFITLDLLNGDTFKKNLIELLTEKEFEAEFTDFIRPACTYVQNIELILKLKWSVKNMEFCTRFLTVFDLSFGLLPSERIIKSDFEYLKVSQTPYKQLKNYQLEVYLESLKELKTDSNKFIIQMPTGSGKTRTAMEIIVTVLNEAKAGEFVVWLAHSTELCEQAEECFMQVWSHAGQGALKIFRAWGDNAGFPCDDLAKGFVIAGFDKTRAMIKNNKIEAHKMKDLCQLIVIDEAHKTIAPSYLTSIMGLSGSKTKTVGLTATPGRSLDNDEENSKLSNFFNDRKITFSSLGNPIEYLRKEKVLASATFVEVAGSDVALTKSQVSSVGEDDFSYEILRSLGEDSLRNIHILKALLIECEKGGQIIYFAPSVEQSKFISSCLVFKGVKAFHVDGSTSTDTRSEKLDLFKSGKIQVICNFGVLTTGFDAPKTDVIFIARPTRSIVLYSQMIGRGLRGPKVGGKASCRIIQVKDNFANFPDANNLFNYFDKYFE